MKINTLIQNGILVETNVKEIDQSTLTTDCWIVQFHGLKACETCDIRNTKECGGSATLIRLGGQNIIQRTRKRHEKVTRRKST